MRLLRLFCCVVVLTVWSGDSKSQTLTQDSLALVDLFNATNGSGWTASTNWLTGPIANWFGVTVAGNRVAILSLSNNQLTGNIPTSLGNLTALTNLQLSGNQLSGSIPSSIGNLVNLTVLRLDNNVLTGTVPSSVGNMSILVELTLFNNQLSDSIPASFASLTDLQTFTLQNNRLDQFPNLSALTALNVLNMSGNRFTFEDIEPNLGVASSFTYSPQDSVGSYDVRSLNEGVSTTMTVTVGGTNNTYQWLKNGNVISGANLSSYTISTVIAGDSGTYSCNIGNTAATSLTLRSRTTKISVSGSAPAAPTNLLATTVSGTRIDLSWTAPAGIVNRYRVQRSLNQSTGFVQIDSTAATAFANTGLTTGTTYFYRVVAVGNFGVSAASNTDSATTFGSPPVVVSAIRDTAFYEGFGQKLIRALHSVFSDPDTPSPIFSAQTNTSEIVAVIQPGDILYVQEVSGFTGSTSVVVSASDGISSVSDTFRVTVLADTVKPTITAVQYGATQAAGTAVTVTCVVKDNISVTGSNLSYRIGNGAFSVLTMTAVVDTYSATIPAGDVTSGGLSFYIQGIDNRNNRAATDTLDVKVTFSGISSRSVSGAAFSTGVPNNRWRLMSVPARLSNSSIAGLFAGSDTTEILSYSYASGNLFATTTIPSQGVFWLKHRFGTDTAAIHAGAGETYGSSVTATLFPGWNLIRNPYPFTISISLPQDTIYGPILYGGTATEVEGWTGVQTTLQPFGGYAVYNRLSASRPLVLRPNGVGLNKLNPGSDDAEVSIRIGARGTKNDVVYGDLYNYFTATGLPNASAFDGPEPSGIGDYVSVFFRRNQGTYTSVFKPANGEGHVFDFYVQSTTDRGDVDLEWTVETAPDGFEMRAFNISENTDIDLQQPVIVRHTEKPVQIRMMIGKLEFIEQATQDIRDELPDRFELGQNYPNPFNPTTRIPFQLNRRSTVSLAIYNTLGQEVRTLLDGQLMETGVHSITWNGRDRIGHAVASGLYLYRIKLETIDGRRISQTRKMMYVK